jgi:hypothetical protein
VTTKTQESGNRNQWERRVAEDPFVFLAELPASPADLADAEYPLTRRHARTLRFERTIRSYLLGGRVAFRRSDLLRYIESRRTDAAEEPLASVR